MIWLKNRETPGELLLSPEKKYLYEETSDGVRIRKYLGQEPAPAVPQKALGETVIALSSNAFSPFQNPDSGKNYETIRIPDTVKVLDADAFAYCTIQKLIIGKGVETIREDALSLAVIHSLEVSPENPYYRKAGPVLLDQRNGKMLLCIPDEARAALRPLDRDGRFWKAEPGFSFRIPDEVRIIGRNSLYLNFARELIIGENVERIEEGAFLILPPKAVRVENNPRFFVENSCLVDKASGTVLRCLSLRETKLALPAQVRGTRLVRIGAFAFAGEEHLEKIRLPESILSVGDYAFYGCSRLNDIRIAASGVKTGQGVTYGTPFYENRNR